MTAEFPVPQPDIPEPEAELPGPQPDPVAQGHPTRAQLTLSPGDTSWEVAVVLYGVPADEWPTTQLPGPEAPTLAARGEALALLAYVQTGPGPHYWEWAECQDGDHDAVRLMAHTEVRPVGTPEAG
ncbi:DUF6303 family protein [Streptomyces sp. NPDC048650]|uniref:DUF6303 family protein n=1 Tax=unclassified Streptomyces TaxID=2593676 RepID=UPI003721E6ED